MRKGRDVLQSDELEKAKAYFTSTKGFARLFKAMAQKYQSLGRWGGSVTLTSPKDEEREAFSALFRADFSRQKSITISLERFAKALEFTKFSSVSPVSLLEEIQGESLISNAERTAGKERMKAGFFGDLLSRYPQPYCQRWLQAIIAKKSGTRPVHTAYETHPELLRVQMDHVLKALSDMNRQLPDKIERLPIFARRITKDPHGFDANSDTGRLLIQAMKILDSEVRGRDPLTFPLTGTEELTELYYSFGLLRDDLWNFVTCTGITAAAVDHENKDLSYLAEAYRQQVTLNLPLREVVRMGNAYAGARSPNESAKVVFVVENSGVFSALLDRFRGYSEDEGLAESPNPPFLCSHGQFKLASLLLLDKLAASGAMIYYSGDFDPEGLLMMERLLLRYPSQAKPWHYTVADYQLAQSEQVISPQRLKQLDRVVSSELVPLAEEILRAERAGYQEGILSELWRDIKAHER
ncbi:TIGR02679 family protein [Desulfosporosinus youngiae]|uniref:TIGR02679 family protein n=1 Tax=Desulfosporosinus youngiae TaxID=339862 RepID=UPI0012F4FF78|nr:TIGR02679 family protein [Desulfosporosinus youngiae]